MGDPAYITAMVALVAAVGGIWAQLYTQRRAARVSLLDKRVGVIRAVAMAYVNALAVGTLVLTRKSNHAMRSDISRVRYDAEDHFGMALSRSVESLTFLMAEQEVARHLFGQEVVDVIRASHVEISRLHSLAVATFEELSYTQRLPPSMELARETFTAVFERYGSLDELFRPYTEADRRLGYSPRVASDTDREWPFEQQPAYVPGDV